MRNLLFPIVFICLLSGILSAQDTTVVQTLTFDSITTRRGIWEFPTGESFRKILMVHTLKCDPLTQHDQYNCGEWDYLTYNKIYEHTGVYDSTLYFHPNFTFVSGSTVDSIPVSDAPTYSFINNRHVNVSYADTISLLEVYIGEGLEMIDKVVQTNFPSGRSQYLWKAEELINAGLDEGYITGIRLHALVISETAEHFMVRIKMVDLEELSPDYVEEDLDTVFYNSASLNDYSFLDFYEPFYWDGISNILIDFSFTNKQAGSQTFFLGDTVDFNCCITDFVKLPTDTYFNSDFTFECWFYKRSNNNWSRIFDFGNGPGDENVLVALSKQTSGKLSIHVKKGPASASFDSDTLPLNEWTHLAVGLWYNIGFLYINGDSIKIGPLKQPGDVERTINYIGRSNWSNDAYADMLLDEFRIYNRKLSYAEIKVHYRQELSYPQSDTSLVLYFPFNEGAGYEVNDYSSNQNHASCFGYPSWYRIRGPEVYTSFELTNARPRIYFKRIETSGLILDYENILDTISNAPVQLVLFEDPDDPTFPTDTIEKYQAGYSYVYENWHIIDSVWFVPDEILYKEDLPYYGEPFEVLEEYEIGRFITPYGINLDLGPQGFTWVFDVTDYAHLLQGDVDLSAGNQQELIDLKFEFIDGTPPRDVLKVDRIWDRYRSYSYKNLDDDISLPAITIPLLLEADEFKVKTRLTGHGHNSNTGEYPHCCEWKDNEHYLMVNGDTITDWHIFQYHDCGLNPVYPQGGTWPGAREGWCPGDLVTDHDFEITQYIIANEVTLDYDITPVPPDNLGMGNGNYVIAMHLIQYDESNFATDAEIYDIVTPSNKDYYSRKNPVCYDPEIIIRNNGTSPLTSLDFEYKVSGGIPQNYTWIGHIEPHCKDTIILPVTFSSFWLGDTLSRFSATISNPNGQMDEYADNNSYQTSFNLPDMYDQPFFFQLKTNNQAYRYHMQIRDVLGNVIIDLDNLENNTIYRDTIDFTDGCYTLELIDDEDMGLSYWAYPEQGSGYLRFFDMDRCS